MEEQIIWSSAAFSDLETIYEYICNDSKFYADRFVQEIEEKVLMLIAQPLVGRVVPEKEDPQIREVMKGNYRIMYSLSKLPVIVIYRIIHVAQNFK